MDKQQVLKKGKFKVRNYQKFAIISTFNFLVFFLFFLKAKPKRFHLVSPQQTHGFIILCFYYMGLRVSSDSSVTAANKSVNTRLRRPYFPLDGEENVPRELQSSRVSEFIHSITVTDSEMEKCADNTMVPTGAES